jgi:hypothetical protein
VLGLIDPENPMRAPALLALSGLLLSVAACATVEPPSMPVAAGAPQPIDGYDWHFSGDDEAARLAYGVEASDDLRLGIDCRRGSGRLELSANAPKGAKPEIHLESGGETERFPAASEPSQVHDGLFLTAEASATEPVFQRFRHEGWLAIWHGDARDPLAPHAGTRPQIERFFAFCG